MKKIIPFLLLFILWGTSCLAQEGSLLYGAWRVPHSSNINPAFFPRDNKFFISLPGAEASLFSPISYNDIFTYNKETQSTIIDFNSLIDTLNANNQFNLGLTIPAIGIGFRCKNSFFTLSSMAKARISFGFPVGLANLLISGNMDYLGEGNEMTLADKSLLNAQTYAEVGLGMGHKFGDYFTLGVRIKFLVGYLNISSENTDIKLFTSEDLSTIRAELNYQLQTSSFAQMQYSQENGFTIGEMNYFPHNYGIGFDIGAQLNLEHVDISASITDLAAFIEWKENLMQIAPANGVVTFTGLNTSQIFPNGQFDSTYFTRLGDSIMSNISIQQSSGKSYITEIPPKVNLGVMLHLGKILHTGVLFHGELFPSDVRNMVSGTRAGIRRNTTLVVDLNLLNWLELMGSLSVVGDGRKTDWFNPGCGMSLSLFKSIQCYAMLNYISNIYLVDAKMVNLSFGVNILLGNKSDKKD